MAFLIYKRKVVRGKDSLLFTGEHFSLAGYNLIYNCWHNQNKPMHKGWHISQDELIAERTKNKINSDTIRLIIDFDPYSSARIGLIELMDIYAYTFGDSSTNEVSWTLLMLKIRNVRYKEGLSKYSQTRIQQLKKSFTPKYGDPSIEFLYLNGSEKGWNWGKSGRTNAAFLTPEVRDYFRQYF